MAWSCLILTTTNCTQSCVPWQFHESVSSAAKINSQSQIELNFEERRNSTWTLNLTVLVTILVPRTRTWLIIKNLHNIEEYQKYLDLCYCSYIKKWDHRYQRDIFYCSWNPYNCNLKCIITKDSLLVSFAASGAFEISKEKKWTIMEAKTEPNASFLSRRKTEVIVRKVMIFRILVLLRWAAETSVLSVHKVMLGFVYASMFVFVFFTGSKAYKLVSKPPKIDYIVTLRMGANFCSKRSSLALGWICLTSKILVVYVYVARQWGFTINFGLIFCVKFIYINWYYYFVCLNCWKFYEKRVRALVFSVE